VVARWWRRDEPAVPSCSAPDGAAVFVPNPYARDAIRNQAEHTRSVIYRVCEDSFIPEDRADGRLPAAGFSGAVGDRKRQPPVEPVAMPRAPSGGSEEIEATMPRTPCPQEPNVVRCNDREWQAAQLALTKVIGPCCGTSKDVKARQQRVG